MWNSAVKIVTDAVTACFGWFGDLLDAIPGSWDSIFTLIVIILISRSLLAPVLGFSFGVGSDTVKAHKSKAEFRRRSRESYNEMKNS